MKNICSSIEAVQIQKFEVHKTLKAKKKVTFKDKFEDSTSEKISSRKDICSRWS